MEAYVLTGIGDLRLQQVERPKCPPGWAVVKVKAAGICSSDLPRIFVKGTYHFPTIPGHEFAGVVDEVASAQDRPWLGKRVGVFPLIPCMQCPQCKQERYEMCSQYDYIGSRRDGAFAEYVAVPVWNLIELPENISYKAGAVMEPFAVALHAVKRVGVERGNRVAVVGTGVIGFAAAQWAAERGALQVCVIGRSEGKRKIAARIPGIEYVVAGDSAGEFDVVIEAVGTSAAIGQAVRLAGASGRIVLAGNPEGTITLEQDAYWRILRKQLCAIGTWNSQYRGDRPSDWTEARDALSRRSVLAEPLITHVFEHRELKRGLALMKNHLEPCCKVMTIWNGGGKTSD